jgi:hypothetical protein
MVRSSAVGDNESLKGTRWAGFLTTVLGSNLADCLGTGDGWAVLLRDDVVLAWALSAPGGTAEPAVVPGGERQGGELICLFYSCYCLYSSVLMRFIT